MSNCILGVITNEDKQSYYSINNLLTTHAEEQSSRLELLYKQAKPLYFFEVFREKDKSRQIHCLMEDSNVVVFNKSNKKIITVIICGRSALEEYLEHVNKDSIDNKIKTRLLRCAKLNKKTGATKVNKSDGFNDEQLSKYFKSKLAILRN